MKSAPVASNVRPGSPATFRLTRPEPIVERVGRCCAVLLDHAFVLAVVISADLIWPGVQVGWRPLISGAEPAMCGLDIEVPAIAWNSSPCGPVGDVD